MNEDFCAWWYKGGNLEQDIDVGVFACILLSQADLSGMVESKNYVNHIVHWFELRQ